MHIYRDSLVKVSKVMSLGPIYMEQKSRYQCTKSHAPLIYTTECSLAFLEKYWYILKMASGERICRPYECSPLLSLFVCVKNDSSKDRFL